MYRKLIHLSVPTNTADKITGMKKLPLLFLFLLLPFASHAGPSLFGDKPEEQKQWLEDEPVLPAFPASKNLIPFDASPVNRNQHFVDATSISVGKDAVVRYTVVIEAPSGAKNISFEGMRCETGERRFYAYGHSDGTWLPARSTVWQEIDFVSGFSYQKILYEEFFCPPGRFAQTPAEAVMNLRRAGR